LTYPRGITTLKTPGSIHSEPAVPFICASTPVISFSRLLLLYSFP